MYSKNFATMALMPHRSQNAEQLTGIGLNGSPVNNRPGTGANGKQRLRWTTDLHDRFVDAIAQLGGPDREAELDLDLREHHLVFICDFVGISCWNNQENRVLALKLPSMSPGKESIPSKPLKKPMTVGSW